MKALELVGRHLGMWNDKVKVDASENPLMALSPQIQDEHSTLPIVRDDPERRQKPDVEDVQAKPPKPATVAGFQRKTVNPTKWRPAPSPDGPLSGPRPVGS